MSDGGGEDEHALSRCEVAWPAEVHARDLIRESWGHETLIATGENSSETGWDEGLEPGWQQCYRG